MTFPVNPPPVDVGSLIVTPDFCHFGTIMRKLDSAEVPSWEVELPGGASFIIDDALARAYQPVSILDPEGQPPSSSVVKTNLWTETQLWLADGVYPFPDQGWVRGPGADIQNFVVNVYCTIPVQTTTLGASKFALMFACDAQQT